MNTSNHERLELSVIVPTLNEAENLKLLVPRLHAALAGRRYELVIVDDNSRDDTPVVCAALAKQYPLQLIVRRQPKNGLSGAVLEGMAVAQGRVLAVMDADLQHPPEKLPELVRVVEGGDADFALGSRYVEGASSDQRWGLARQLNSWVATWLARPFAGPVTDPMSGFFALRRETYEQAETLTPLGYKIALELMCKCRVRRVVEVPIHFGIRQAGESKLNVKQQFKYLEHLSRLYDFCFPRLSPMAKFLAATGMAWFVGLAAYLTALRWVNDIAVAASFAYGCGIGVICVFFMRYVRTQRDFISRRRPWLDFTFTSLAEWSAACLAAVYAAHRMGSAHPLELLGIAFAVGTVVRYVLRKEFMQDIRGLRRDVRVAESGGPSIAAHRAAAAIPDRPRFRPAA